MGIVRTAKGTASAKTSGTTLTLSSVTVTAGRTLVVGIAYDNSHGDPVVKLKNKEFRLVPGSKQANGIGTVAFFRKLIHKSGTRDVVATWTDNITARVMFVTEITEASKKDVGNSNANDSTTAPGTGSAATSTAADTISIAAFASLGPSSDTPGSAGVGHTLGQRVGTTGSPPTSNATIQETYEILSATGNVRSALSGATSRDWASTVIAFKATQKYTVKEVKQRLNPLIDGEQVTYVMESETPGDIFEANIDLGIYDGYSDDEVTAFLNECCTWHSDHLIDNITPLPVGDATRNTRMATFVDDEVVI